MISKRKYWSWAAEISENLLNTHDATKIHCLHWRSASKKYAENSERVCDACVILDSVYVRVCADPRYRAKAKNQYDITLRPALSRLVTEISKKTERDETHESLRNVPARGGSAFIFGFNRIRAPHS